MRILLAPDKFKNVLDAPSVAEALAAGIRTAGPDFEVDLAPMADGGEGTLDCLLDAYAGQRKQVTAHDPLGRPLQIDVGLIHRATTAVVELARVSGYSLLSDAERDPARTTTFGLGEVLRTVCETGVEHAIIGLGGSATVDGGAGMMQGLGLRLLDARGRPLADGIGGGGLTQIRDLTWANPPENLHEIQITLACDVLNSACGPNGAAKVFGPQKGADARTVKSLERGLEHWAALLEARCGRPIRNEPGSGAAGAAGLPLLAFTQASIMPGVDLVCEARDLAARILAADLVITGEGRLDAQSMMGKVVGAVGRLARNVDVPCIAVVGTTGPGSDQCLECLDRFISLDGPIAETAERLKAAGERIAREA